MPCPAPLCAVLGFTSLDTALSHRCAPCTHPLPAGEELVDVLADPEQEDGAQEPVQPETAEVRGSDGSASIVIHRPHRCREETVSLLLCVQPAEAPAPEQAPAAEEQPAAEPPAVVQAPKEEPAADGAAPSTEEPAGDGASKKRPLEEEAGVAAPTAEEPAAKQAKLEQAAPAADAGKPRVRGNQNHPAAIGMRKLAARKATAEGSEVLFPVGTSPIDLPIPRRLRTATARRPRSSRAAWGRLKQVSMPP